MNSNFNLLIKLLMVLVIVLIVVVVLFVAKVTNFSFDNLNKDEPVKPIKKTSKELSDDEVKKINDSMEQRENRIKSLKEVGKNLGG